MNRSFGEGGHEMFMLWLREDGGFRLGGPRGLLVDLFGDVSDCESDCESHCESAKAMSLKGINT